MSALRLIPLGVGDAFSERHYSSSLAVEAPDGSVLLVDCPHPMRKMLHDAAVTSGVPLDPARIVGVALTHLHGDHASGLESFAYFFHFALGRKLRIACHRDVRARLWDGHLAAGMEQTLPSVGAPFRRHGFDDWFEWVPLDEAHPVELGGFSVRCRPTIHHIPTTALRIGVGGRELAYSADTAFDEGLIAWLAEANLVVHETNYGVHTPLASLSGLPAPLRERMRLIHYPDALEASGTNIALLRQGVVIEV